MLYYLNWNYFSEFDGTRPFGQHDRHAGFISPGTASASAMFTEQFTTPEIARETVDIDDRWKQ